MPEKHKIIEENQPLSQSKLWQFQRDYFDRAGIEAWSSQVPFYVTSNPYIAKCYARLVMSMARDWLVRHPEAIKEPFYIVELGTGSGRFSYYVLKELAILQAELNLSELNFRYIMTDFTLNNVKFWQDQPQLKAFINNGVLDFALYDLEEETPLKLINSGLSLTAGAIKNPLSIFANYIFDTVTNDCFYAQNGELQQCLISLSAAEHQFEDGSLKNLEALQVTHEKAELPRDFYEDPVFHELLQGYRAKFKETHFLIPIGGLKALRYLMKLANGKTLLISSDKGYSTLKELDHNPFPAIAFHGSFSMMVNFHALAEYYRLCNGSAVVQTPRKGIRSLLGLSELSLAQMPNTRLAIHDYIQGFSAADYFNLHRRMSDSFKECSAAVLASHLQLSDWDPQIFQKMARRINELLPDAEPNTIDYLTENMPKIADNFYFMPKSHDVMFDIAYFYHALHQYPEAIKYYHQSEKYFGLSFNVLYNLGLCYYYNQQPEQSLAYFHRAAEKKPEDVKVKEWIEFVKKS